MIKALNNFIMVFVVFMSPINPYLFQAHAGTFGESADYGKYSAGFTGKVYDDGNSIGYAIGGKYTLKRKTAQPQVWFNGSGPELSAGCGGISFKGGFMSLLNLDQIGEQLKDAGAAFAWGIMLGLVTSLPSIKEVFDTINKWAKQIQSLLSNACSIGKNMQSKYGSLKNKEIAGNELLDDMKNDTGMMAYIQQKSAGFSEFVSDGLNNIEGELSGGDIPKEKRMSVLFTTISEAFKIPGLGSTVMYSFAERYAMNIDKALGLDFLDDNGFSLGEKITDFGADPDGVSGDMQGFYNFQLMVAIIVYNLEGSTKLTSSGQKQIENLMASGNKLISPGGDAAKEAFEKEQDSIEKEFQKSGNFVGPVRPGEGFSEDDVIEWLTNGLVQEKAAQLYLPGLLPLNVVAGTHSGGDKTSRIFLMDIESEKKVKDIGYWKEVFKSYGNVSQLARDQVSCLKKSTPAGVDCSSLPPVILPKPREYMYIFGHANEEEQDMLGGFLEGLFEYYLVEAFVDQFDYVQKRLSSGAVLGASKAPGAGSEAPPTGNSIKKIKDAIADKLAEKLRVLMASKSESLKKSLTEIEKLFIDQNERNHKRALAATPK